MGVNMCLLFTFRRHPLPLPCPSVTQSISLDMTVGCCGLAGSVFRGGHSTWCGLFTLDKQVVLPDMTVGCCGLAGSVFRGGHSTWCGLFTLDKQVVPSNTMPVDARG